MKNTSKLVLLVAVAMSATQAYASKSRVNALQGAMTVANDVEDLGEKPGRITTLPDSAVFEFGASSLSYGSTTTTANSPNSQGGVIRSFGNHKVGLYLGRQSANFTYIARGSSNGLGAHFTATEDLYLDNPLTLTYGTKMGDLGWGASLFYANSARKINATSKFSKSAQGLTLSAGDGVWEAFLVLSLGGKVKDETTGTATAGDEAKGASAFKLGGQYSFGSSLVFLDYSTLGTQYAVGSTGTVTSKLSTTAYNLGVETMIKGEGTHFFYGVKYAAASESQSAETNAANGVKVETASLPVTIGVEADAASWLVLRGSLVQPVLIGNSTLKTSAASNTDSMLDNNSVRFGSSLKFNKFAIDMLMYAGTTGQLNANNFGTSAALNYVF